MRRFLYFLLVVASVVCLLGSCKNTDNAEYTPYISFSVFLRNPVFSHDSIVGCEDTLRIAYDSSSNKYLLDTVSLSDTVVFVVGFGSRGNDLKAALVTYDSAALAMRCDLSKEIEEVLTEQSDVRKTQLYFVKGYNFVLFPMGYKPRKAGVHQMVFEVQSDSKYSPVKHTLVQPVSE